MQEDAGNSILCMTGTCSYSLYISFQGLPLVECKQIICLNKNSENAGGKKRKRASQFLPVAA